MSDARERPAAQPPKKRMSRGTRVLVIIVCVLLAIALILLGVCCRKRLEAHTMQIVVVRSPKFLSAILRLIFGIKKEE